MVEQGDEGEAKVRVTWKDWNCCLSCYSGQRNMFHVINSWAAVAVARYSAADGQKNKEAVSSVRSFKSKIKLATSLYIRRKDRRKGID